MYSYYGRCHISAWRGMLYFRIESGWLGECLVGSGGGGGVVETAYPYVTATQRRHHESERSIHLTHFEDMSPIVVTVTTKMDEPTNQHRQEKTPNPIQNCRIDSNRWHLNYNTK